MRNLGIVLIFIGMAMIAYTGFNFVTTEKVIDLGSVEITKEKNNPVRWSPFVGVALLAGGVILVLRNKTART